MPNSAIDELPDAWLSEDPLPNEPVSILKRWLDEAFAARLQDSPHAVSLATIEPDGRPAARMVLCNAVDVERGEFVMYTNRESRKGRALAQNPRGAMVFHWGPQGRSARVEGAVTLTPDEECDAYFATRPLDAKIGAWASAQSEPIASREAMVAKVAQQAERFGVSFDDFASNTQSDVTIPRPPHWGGFTLHAELVELWVSRPARIHDRAQWTRSSAPAGTASSWTSQRLQP
jgi:pyridoxamine 5'-phosphate oxidase